MMIIATIHNLFDNLTETEQKIASYILEFPEKVVNMTAKELANACGTVPSAVNRMCRSIGLEGFAKLKISLATAVGREGYSENNIPFDKDDNSEKIFNKVFNSGINTLKSTYQMIDFSKIDEQDYIRFKQEKYQYEVLTDNKENIIKKYDITTIDKPSIEDIMLLYVKGEK